VKIFKFQDVEVRYKVEGESGPVYILLHGFGGGPNDWSAVSAELAKTSRVVSPNLKSFFSHHEPLTFSQQVGVLSHFVNEILARKGVSEIHIMGQSYGATLSLGLRLETSLAVGEHVLLNPMPFRPFSFVRNREIGILLNMGAMPGGVKLFLKSAMGRQGLQELAKVFRIGALGHHEIHHFNERKLMLVEKAFERFRWILKNENWFTWEERLSRLPFGAITRFIYSRGDTLFLAEDYQRWAEIFKAGDVVAMPHNGHLLVQDIGVGVLNPKRG
jgi:pimeloyl-ACP methyl ester carboxylesterase